MSSDHPTKPITPSGGLTPDQRERIEANKLRALAKLKEKQPTASNKQTTTHNNSPNAGGKSQGSKSYFYNSKSSPSFPAQSESFTSKHVTSPPKPDRSRPPVKKTQLKLVLLSRKRFEVVSPFDPALVALVKTFPDRSYDQIKRTWSLNVENYSLIVKRLKSSGYILEEIPQYVIAMLTDKNDQLPPDVTMRSHSIHPKIIEHLLPFQKESLNFGVAKRGKLIIADDMGLGKTLQAIALACYYRCDWPVLVICPSSIRIAWKQAFLRWIPTLVEDDIQVVLSRNDSAETGIVNITSYEMLLKNVQQVSARGYNFIIADESHFLKNSKAERTKAALPLLQKASHAILLSGTPALSRPEELYTQISAVNKNLFPSFIPFAKRYCNAMKNAFNGWDTSGASNLEELKVILEERVMIRRMKSEIMAQLPEKTRHLVTLDPSLINTAKLDRSAMELCKATEADRQTQLLRYFQLTSSCKSKAVRMYIKDLLQSGIKFIVFAHHKIMLNAISDLLIKNKTEFIRIDGSTPPECRQEAVKRFQEDGTCLVAVLSILAAGVGITLTAATTVVFAELYWNPGALIQAEDRVYRIGQKNAVTVVYLVARKTADDYIWPIVQEKLKVLATAGIGQSLAFDPILSTYQDHRQKELLDYFQQCVDEEGDRLMAELTPDVMESQAKRAKVDE